jgi:hypothetical protein
VVDAFVAKDYRLARGVPGVAPIAPTKAAQIEDYLVDYGETLAALPEATWTTSVSQWNGEHWDVLVDLWTAESGRSDMVLAAKVFEAAEGFRFEIRLVYVP